jgi:hypothetical protein
MSLARFVGYWFTEATHPAMPGVVVHGSVSVEWLEGERFLIHRARTDHPDFPDSIAIIGNTDADRAGDAAAAGSRMTMHYFDSRGVFRVYEASVDDEALRFSRLAPGMSQRYTGTFTDGGNAIDGLWQMCEDGTSWHDDLKITYRRTSK